MNKITNTFARLGRTFLAISAGLLFFTYQGFGGSASILKFNDKVILVNILEPGEDGISRNEIIVDDWDSSKLILINNSSEDVEVENVGLVPANPKLSGRRIAGINIWVRDYKIVAEGMLSVGEGDLKVKMSIRHHLAPDKNLEGNVRVVNSTNLLNFISDMPINVGNLSVKNANNLAFTSYLEGNESKAEDINVKGQVSSDGIIILDGMKVRHNGKFICKDYIIMDAKSECIIDRDGEINLDGQFQARCHDKMLNHGNINVDLFNVTAGALTNSALWSTHLWTEQMKADAWDKGVLGDKSCGRGEMWTDGWGKEPWKDVNQRTFESKILNSGSIKAKSTELYVLNDLKNIDGGNFEITGKKDFLSKINVGGQISNLNKKVSNQKGRRKDGFEFHPSVLKLNDNFIVECQNGGFLNEASFLSLTGTGTVNLKKDFISRGKTESYEDSCDLKIHVLKNWMKNQCAGTDHLPLFICAGTRGTYYIVNGDWPITEEEAAKVILAYVHLPDILKHGENIVFNTKGSVLLEGTNVIGYGKLTFNVAQNFKLKAIMVPIAMIAANPYATLLSKDVNPQLLAATLNTAGTALVQPVGSYEVSTANGALGMYGGGTAIVDGTLTVNAGGAIEVEGGTILSRETTLKAGKGILLKGWVDAYLDQIITGKGLSGAIYKLVGREAVVGSLDKVLILSPGADAVRSEGGSFYAGAGGIEFQGKTDMKPITATAHNFIKQKKRRVLSKTVSVEEWSSSLTLRPKVLSVGDVKFMGQDNKLVGAVVRSLEGNVVIPQGAQLEIRDYQVPYYYRKTVTKSGFKLPGFSGAALQALNGRDFTDALEDNVAILSSMKALGGMDDVKDLAPAVQFAVQIYQIAEDFSQRYKLSKGDTVGSAFGTTMSQLGFTKLGGYYVPSGVGFYKSVVTTEERGADIFQAQINGKLVSFSFEEGLIEGGKFTAETLVLHVQNGLKMLASEVQKDFEQKTQTQEYGVHYGEGNVVSVVAGLSTGKAKITQRVYSPVEITANTVEVKAGGDVLLQGIVHADKVLWDVKGQTVIESLQDETKIDEKSRKIELTLGVGPDTLFGGGGYGEGKGKGRTKEVKKQSGIYAEEIDMKSGRLSLKGAYIVAKRGRISVRELMYQHLEDKHDYKNYSFYINSSPITMLANQFGKAAESMTPRNTTDGSAILGSLAFDHRSETRRGTTFATVAEGIEIETDSDISGLNRDASRLKEVTKDTKSHMSMMVPIVDFDKLKSNIKEIAQTYDSLKSKMAERFKGWKTAANEIESQSQQAEMTQAIAQLESDYQKMMEKLAKSEASEDEKMEQAKKLELALMDAVEGGGIQALDYSNHPEFRELGGIMIEGDSKIYSPYEIAKAGGIDALREKIAKANMIKAEKALQNSFLVKHGDGERVTRLMFAVDSVQNHELFMEKLGRYLGATGDYTARFTVSGMRTFVEITFGTLKDSFEGYTLMVNLADEMLKGDFQKDIRLMANLEDGQFKELMTDYGIEIAINTWKELKELGPKMLEAVQTAEGQGSIVAVACTMKPWKAAKVLKAGGKKKGKGKDHDNDNNKSNDESNESKKDQESSPERVMTQEEMISQLKPEVRERIRGMEIPEPKVRGGGMLAHEARGGHGLEKHMERTVEELAARFDVNSKLERSSTFTKWKRAEDLIEETMQKKQHEIDVWLKNGKKGNLRLQQPFDEVVGITLLRDSDVIHHVNDVVVILKKDPTSKLGYFILTAHPEIKILL